jgi:hypothetical protein
MGFDMDRAPGNAMFSIMPIRTRLLNLVVAAVFVRDSRHCRRSSPRLDELLDRLAQPDLRNWDVVEATALSDVVAIGLCLGRLPAASGARGAGGQ